MASVNKVFVLGYIGKDPELRYTPSGTANVTISVATSRSWTSKDSGERTEETEWHRIVAWDKLAEIIGEYLHKGDQVHIEGRLKTRKWEKDGVTHYTTEIVAEQMTMLGKRDKADAAPAPRPAAPSQAPRQATRTPAVTGDPGFDDMNDDLPF